MNELQRQGYLQAMGVDVIVPRFILPAAKASLRCVLPDVVIAIAPSPEVPLSPAHLLEPSVKPIAAPVPAQKSPALEKNTFADIITDQSVTEGVRSPVRITSEKAPQFQLLFACCAGLGSGASSDASAQDLVFVVRSHSGLLSRDQQRLLHEIAFSMADVRGASGLQWQYESFRWPLQKDKKLEQGEDAARQTLQGYMHRFDGRKIVVMGKLAAHYLLPTSTAAEALGKDGGLYFPDDLDELLSRPALKRQLWQQLQLLAQGLRKKHH